MFVRRLKLLVNDQCSTETVDLVDDEVDLVRGQSRVARESQPEEVSKGLVLQRLVPDHQTALHRHAFLDLWCNLTSTT
jgi:hypothetical protein